MKIELQKITVGTYEEYVRSLCIVIFNPLQK